MEETIEILMKVVLLENYRNVCDDFRLEFEISMGSLEKSTLN